LQIGQFQIRRLLIGHSAFENVRPIQRVVVSVVLVDVEVTAGGAVVESVVTVSSLIVSLEPRRA
jgi:hypothetical protein